MRQRRGKNATSVVVRSIKIIGSLAKSRNDPIQFSDMENNADQNTQENTGTAENNQTTGNGASNGNGTAQAAPAGQPASAPSPDALAEAQQKYVYLYAEFENYKKRAFKERQDTVKFALEGAAAGLLEVLDNLERALQHAKPDGDPNLVEGLKMVMNQFKSTLQKQNVVEIPTEGQAFNPEFHEAVGQLPSDKPQGTIVQTVQKGYTLHGRLVRPARVLISAGAA
jgi:molecular chaperone GrpE